MNADDYEVPTRPVLPDDPGEATVHGWSDAPVAGDRVDVHMGPIIAGDPAGARVEITGDGLHAYDATGTETARIQGEEGVFVGGEFRTSDTLPGQVRLSDTAADGGPGLQVAPSGAGSYETLPWIGPRNGGISVDGGKDGAGNGSYAFVSPRMVNLQTSRDGKEVGSVYISENMISISRYGDQGEMGEIAAFPGFVSVGYEHDGVKRGLAIDQRGVWVETNRDGVAKSYNLEETAQDSGWQAFSPVAGMDSYALAWRNKGGVIYMRGTVTATWQAGWNTVATNLPAEMRPAIRVVRQAPSTSEQGLYFRMGNDGVLEFNKPTAGTRTGDLSAIFYPAD